MRSQTVVNAGESSVEPARGSANGGVHVTITGAGFQAFSNDLATVRCRWGADGAPTTTPIFMDDRKIVCLSAARPDLKGGLRRRVKTTLDRRRPGGFLRPPPALPGPRAADARTSSAIVSIIAAACAKTRTMLSVYLRIAEMARPLKALLRTRSQTTSVYPCTRASVPSTRGGRVQVSSRAACAACAASSA